MDAKTRMGFDVPERIKLATADFEQSVGAGVNDHWVQADPYRR